MDYLVEAYLDDYQKITVKIKRRFHNGDCDVFFAQLNEELYPLSIQNRYEKEDEIVYDLTYDFDLLISKPYEVVIRDGYRVALQYRFIVKSQRFNDEYLYQGNDLGALVKDNETVFKLWAPTASAVHLVLDDKYYAMIVNKGVYSITFNEDLSGKAYQYLVNVNGNTYLTNDPYAKASLANNIASVVVKWQSNTIQNEKEIDYRDTIIYEASVRDFSKEGLFRSFNIDYLRDLGITHLQLLPIQDFASVDEYHKQVFYNWGYDPLNYQCLEGSYSSNINNPLQVIDDFKEFVEECHENNIKVNLDIVFNHHYNNQVSCFNRTVPYYYFRYDGEKLCDGTYCGNEFDSQQLMMRKYIIDTLKYYVNNFDVDGFRFDLMNFIDIKTMQILQNELKEIKPSIMLYGEGWNMQTTLPPQQRSIKENKNQLENIAFFNDNFRDIMLGDVFSIDKSGYIANNSADYDSALNAICNQEKNLINYVQCHDNYTLYDKLKAHHNDDETTIKRVIVANGIVMLSFGIVFMNQYQEHGISKQALSNCYNVKDEINNLTNHPQNPKIYKFVKDIITFRQNSQFYRQSISNQSSDNGVIIIDVDKFTFIINITDKPYPYQLQQDKQLVIDNGGFVNKRVKDTLLVEPISIVILEG